MNIFEAIVLGAIQGLTEFLPVSSSGHLVLLQKIFGIAEPMLLFDTLVHVGTLIAVFIVLWNDISTILRRIVQPLTGYLILATIPTVIVALLLKDFIEETFQSAAFLGFSFLFTALALLVSEQVSRFSVRVKPQAAMDWFDALVIGICQAIAIIPGVSRSGLTISGALSRRLNRDFAARFAFLLSIPAILGALILQLKDLAKSGFPPTMDPASMIAGTVTAAVIGFFSIKFMLKIVKTRSFRGFALYMAILGFLVLADQHFFHFFF
ncbi:undecaprenyl-diphosphate phosphatase [Treponema primitia]|uniref:undecaprenyl-diphosphate phosphatase n=1 Tax=Treponema primitia TaxID=88058 RepID=UPI00397EBB90